LVPNCPDRAGTKDRRTLPRPGDFDEARARIRESVGLTARGSGGVGRSQPGPPHPRLAGSQPLTTEMRFASGFFSSATAIRISRIPSMYVALTSSTSAPAGSVMLRLNVP